MKKVLKAMVLAILMVGCLVSGVMAAVVVPIEPQWDNVNRVACEITFNGTRGTVMCDITAISAATSITGTLTLYEAGVEIDSWEIDSDMPFATVIDTFTGTRGYTYTLSLDAVVTANNLDEPITCTASKKCS